jgi:hypothetical protein
MQLTVCLWTKLTNDVSQSELIGFPLGYWNEIIKVQNNWNRNEWMLINIIYQQSIVFLFFFFFLIEIMDVYTQRRLIKDQVTIFQEGRKVHIYELYEYKLTSGIIRHSIFIIMKRNVSFNYLVSLNFRSLFSQMVVHITNCSCK